MKKNKVVALDIETRDPAIYAGHGYLHEDFLLLDCGASYFDDEGVLVSRSFDLLTDVKKGMVELVTFLRDHKFDKIVWHNAKYDLPRLMFYGFPVREFYHTDTMLYSTLLEPFRTSNTLKDLCIEYNQDVKKISAEEMVDDISNLISQEFSVDKDKDTKRELQQYVKKHYFINLKKIPENFLELRSYFPSVYKEYLTADTEATLLLYYKLDAIMDKLCEKNFDTTFAIDGKTLKDVLKTEELGIIPDIYMSVTQIPIDWERVESEKSRYLEEINKLYKEYEIFFTFSSNFKLYSAGVLEFNPIDDLHKIELALNELQDALIEKKLNLRTRPFIVDLKSLKYIKQLANDYIIHKLKMTDYKAMLVNFIGDAMWVELSELPQKEYLKASNLISNFAESLVEPDFTNTLTEIPEVNSLTSTIALIESKYPDMFIQELDLIKYCDINLKNGSVVELAIKKLLQNSFIFQDINSINQKKFKEIVNKYIGDLDIPDKFRTNSGGVSLSTKGIKYIKTLENIPKEISLIINLIDKFNNITTNYNKFIKPFLKSKETKGGLYTELYSYKTAMQKSFTVGSDDALMGTVTGRMSSNNFNIQTIPKPEGDTLKVRSLFLPRTTNFQSDKVKFISVDWSGQENRLGAILGKVSLMLDMYRKDQYASTHEKTVVDLRLLELKDGMTESEVVEAKAKAKAKAKGINFAMFYFQEAYNLSVSLGIPKEDGEKLIADFHGKYPEVLEFYKQGIRSFAKNGYVANMYGRIYKPYKFPVLYNLDEIADNFELGKRLSFPALNFVMRNRNDRLKEFLGKIIKLDSFSFYNKLITITEYADLKPLPPYSYYEKLLADAKQGFYESNTLSEIIYLMFNRNLLYPDDDSSIKDIILIHAKLCFKDHSKFNNKDYYAECLILKNKPVKRQYPYNSAVRKLKGEDFDLWDSSDTFQTSKYVWFLAWYICNYSIEYTFDFLKKIVNAMCQGSGADMLKEAKANMWKDGITDPSSPNFCFDVHFPVHDAFEGTILEENQEKTIAIIKKYMEFEFDGVKMKVATNVGDRWE